jgi:DNA-binding Lrp family transcriptional regulator
MLTAILMAKIEHGRVNEVAEALAAIPGVSEVYSVTGEWDIVALVRVRENEELAEVVTRHAAQIPGIQRTNTLLAFRTFSRYDLEHIFGVGLEKDRG